MPLAVQVAIPSCGRIAVAPGGKGQCVVDRVFVLHHANQVVLVVLDVLVLVVELLDVVELVEVVVLVLVVVATVEPRYSMPELQPGTPVTFIL